MYIRFVVPVFRRDSRAEAGIFYWAYWVRNTDHFSERWLRDELAQELRWFDDNLPVPERLVMRFRRRNPIHGICWFCPEASEHINRARYISWLMNEAGAPVREVHAENPGQIIWRDPYQVVSKSETETPSAFH
ncbi:MAG: hypothetical protein GY947_23245 [Rhodobacteraceae bacterium]|nr:hypothetical protein [Paracoccaceae bacterium]